MQPEYQRVISALMSLFRHIHNHPFNAVNRPLKVRQPYKHILMVNRDSCLALPHAMPLSLCPPGAVFKKSSSQLWLTISCCIVPYCIVSCRVVKTGCDVSKWTNKFVKVWYRGRREKEVGYIRILITYQEN